MPKVPKEIVLQREKEAWDLRTRKGMTHAKIAEQIGLERSAVTKILKRVGLRASKNLLDDAVEEKLVQLNQLRSVVEEAFAAWDRSKEAAKTMTQYLKTVSVGDAEGALKNSSIRVQDQDGDPRYLETAMRAMAEIRKLLGLDSPQKLLNIDLEKLTDDQLERIIKGEDPMTVILSGYQSGSQQGG